MEGFTKEKIMSRLDSEERLKQKIEYKKQEFYFDGKSEHLQKINDLERQASRMAALRHDMKQEQARNEANAEFAQQVQNRITGIPFIIKAPEVDRTTLPIYSPRDVDSLIAMLTLWIDDRKVIQNMEEMYKHWKATQKI